MLHISQPIDQIVQPLNSEYTVQYACMTRFSNILQCYMFMTIKALGFGTLWAFYYVFEFVCVCRWEL